MQNEFIVTLEEFMTVFPNYSGNPELWHYPDNVYKDEDENDREERICTD